MWINNKDSVTALSAVLRIMEANGSLNALNVNSLTRKQLQVLMIIFQHKDVIDAIEYIRSKGDKELDVTRYY